MRRKLLFLGLVFSVFSCGTDEEQIESLDNILENTLIEASQGQGLDFFKMPSSDDYANIPQDPNNPITTEKVTLGKLLYHETGIALKPEKTAGKGTYSCASCHFASAGFQANRHQGIGDGGVGFGANGEKRRPHDGYLPVELDVQPIRTPTAMNGAYQEVMLWNGQFGATGPNVGTEANWTPGTPKENNMFGYQGLETQAIAGLDVHRLVIKRDSMLDMGYLSYFDKAFPEIPEAARYGKASFVSVVKTSTPSSP